MFDINYLHNDGLDIASYSAYYDYTIEQKVDRYILTVSPSEVYGDRAKAGTYEYPTFSQAIAAIEELECIDGA